MAEPSSAVGQDATRGLEYGDTNYNNEKAAQTKPSSSESESETEAEAAPVQYALPRLDTYESEFDHNNVHLDRTTTGASSYVAPHLSLWHEICFVGVVCSAQLMTQAGLGPALTTGHVIGENFGLQHPGDLAWFLAAYSLTVGTFILVAGRLGDLFGHKRMVVLGYAWFGVWSIICGLSVYSGYIMFDIARALQGLGPALLLPNGLAILGSAYPPGPRKHMVFALFGACAPGGAIIGSVFAGLFALVWWPWAFWSFGLGLFALAALAWFIIPADGPSYHDQRETGFAARLKQMDVAGGSVGVVALILINVAWNQAPIAGWDEPYVIVLLILGVLLVPVFFYIELRIASNPILPLEALKSSDIAFVLGCIACGWGCFGIWIFYLWQFYLQLREATPLLATAWFSPVALSGAAAAVATGLILGRIGPAWTMVCALSAFLAGVLLIATMPIDQTYWGQGFVCVLIMTWGMDMSFPASTVILSDAVGKKHQGIAASLVNTVVNYSISLALGFAGTAEVHVHAGREGKQAVLEGYRAALYVGVGLAGLGWLLSLVFLWHHTRRNKQRQLQEREAEKRTGEAGVQ